MDIRKYCGIFLTGTLFLNKHSTNGYRRRFGLFHTELNNGDVVARTAKRSAYVYRQIKDTRKIPIDLPILPPPDPVFPPNFLFGCSSSSYQIEGAWDRDGIHNILATFMTYSNKSKIKNRR